MKHRDIVIKKLRELSLHPAHIDVVSYIKAIERATQTEVIKKTTSGGWCPLCNSAVFRNYCPNCGQALKWIK